MDDSSLQLINDPLDFEVERSNWGEDVLSWSYPSKVQQVGGPISWRVEVFF